MKSILAERYASPEMGAIFSPENRYRTWRKLWVAHAIALKNSGYEIKEEEIQDLQDNVDKVDLEAHKSYEKRLKHEVVAEIRAFADQCKKGGRIIHLGATSAFVMDNTDIINMKQGLELLLDRVVFVVRALSKFAEKHSGTTCVGYTHFQPAQLTTVGKRACLWLQDFVTDLENLERLIDEMPLHGMKGAVGTQDSYLKLIPDAKNVLRLDEHLKGLLGFKSFFPITGQTYPRKLDAHVAHSLACIAVSASKMCSDIRLLHNLDELHEPFGEEQVGSSAMPYKRNPMMSERVCSIARMIINAYGDFAHTAATQWLERSLDDSAIRRIVMPDTFMAADAILIIVGNISKGMQPQAERIRKNLDRQVAHVLAEPIIMAGVKDGGNRQEIHQRLRNIFIKQDGGNMLLALEKDKVIGKILKRHSDILDSATVPGLARLQTTNYVKNVVKPILKKFAEKGKSMPEVEV